MVDVFISYARQDSAKALPIKQALEDAGLSVYFDTEALEGGRIYTDQIDEAVKSAGVILGIWSKHALTRRWVKAECGMGLERGVLVPVQIEPIDDLDKPTSFYGVQHIDLFDFDGTPTHPGWQHTLRALARLLKRPDLIAGLPEAKIIEPPPLWQSRRVQWAAGLVALGLALLAALILPRVSSDPVWQQVEATDWALDPGAQTFETLRPELNAQGLYDAATDGDMQAATLLGIAHIEGMDGALIDETRAFSHLSNACAGDIGLACLWLGSLYRDHAHPEYDIGKAAAAYQTGCDLGALSACASLAHMYERGRGVEADPLKAADLLNETCAKGYALACTSLGLWHVSGTAVPQSFTKAAEFYRTACDLREPLACGRLGDMLMAGRGVEADNFAAVRLRDFACQNGEPDFCN